MKTGSFHRKTSEADYDLLAKEIYEDSHHRIWIVDHQKVSGLWTKRNLGILPSRTTLLMTW